MVQQIPTSTRGRSILPSAAARPGLPATEQTGVTLRAAPPRILHVCEALGGGVTTALIEFVNSSPGYEHHLIARLRSSDHTGAQIEGHFASVTWLPGSFRGWRRTIRGRVRALIPDVVHAHSSKSGALVRVTAGVRAEQIVYSPHCYAFERRDVSRLVRAAYGLVEWLLAHRHHWVAAVSPREAAIASRLNGSSRVTYVPNVVRLAPRSVALREPFTVVAAGRVTSQKDPDWFATAAAASRRAGSRVRWVWLGGGDAAATRRLEEAGVMVSGWLSRERLLAEMTNASAYVHTAAWEGAPVSVLEAAALGLPIVGRRIPALESLAVPGLCDTPAALAEAVEALRAPEQWCLSQRASRLLRERHQPQAQVQALAELYMSVRQATLRIWPSGSLTRGDASPHS